MPAPKGVLYESVKAVVDELADLGIQAVTDPRNARPNTVFVELPTVTNLTYNVADCRLVLRLLAPPPGNQDAADSLMTLADKVINSALAVTDARPSFANYGGQELPSYDLTVAVAVKRN